MAERFVVQLLSSNQGITPILLPVRWEMPTDGELLGLVGSPQRDKLAALDCSGVRVLFCRHWNRENSALAGVWLDNGAGFYGSCSLLKDAKKLISFSSKAEAIGGLLRTQEFITWQIQTPVLSQFRKIA